MIEQLQLEIVNIIRNLKRTLSDIDELQLIIKDARFANGRMNLIRAIDEFRNTEMLSKTT